MADALKAAGYPTKADMAKFDTVTVVAILTYLVILVTMVYGPIAAMLVELFPHPYPLHIHVACLTTSATAGSAACCPPRRLPSWPRPATCTTACGTPSSSQA